MKSTVYISVTMEYKCSCGKSRSIYVLACYITVNIVNIRTNMEVICMEYKTKKPTYKQAKKAYEVYQSGMSNGGEFWDVLAQYFKGDKE